MIGGTRQQEAKQKALDLRQSTGKTWREVMGMVGGRSENTYFKWRDDDEDFRIRADIINSKLRSRKPEVIKRPFDPEFRQHYFGLDTPLHIQLSMDLINDLKPGEAGAICLPPEHAKSAISEDVICHKVAHDPNIRILLVSKARDHAIKLLGRVKRRMTDYSLAEDFINDYGPFKSPDREKELVWQRERIIVAKQTSGERDYTIEAVGVGGQVLGTRTDWMLLDDIADPTNQGAAEIEKQLEWIRLVAFTRIGITGSQLFIFNRIKEVDVYKHLFDDGFFDKTLIIPAERPRGYLNNWKLNESKREPVMTEPDPGGYLWPERFGVKGYEHIKKKVGGRVWELNYQQKDEVTEGAKFPREVVEGCFNPQFSAKEVPDDYVVVTGIDPSAVNYTAGVALGVNLKTKRRLLIDVWNQKGLMGDGGDIQQGLVQFILKLNGQYRSRRCCLESNSTFVLLSHSEPLRSGLSDMGVHLQRERTLKQENDDLGIEQLSALFVNNMIDIPAADGGKVHFRSFIEQLVRWRPGDRKIVKDMVKAFQFAELAARSYLKREADEMEYEGPPLPEYVRRKQKTMAAR